MYLECDVITVSFCVMFRGRNAFVYIVYVYEYNAEVSTNMSVMHNYLDGYL